VTILIEELKTFLSGAAFVVALISLYFTRVNWLQSNRPIVTAYLCEHKSGNLATAFNLVVSNTGSRPAIRVRLHATHSQIRELTEGEIDLKRFEMLESVFDPTSEIPLLRNNESLTTSFGAYVASESDKWLKYGAKIDISVTYSDLEGRSYKSRQPLKIYIRTGFGGGSWN
jgi:hypothetical protein